MAGPRLPRRRMHALRIDCRADATRRTARPARPRSDRGGRGARGRAETAPGTTIATFGPGRYAVGSADWDFGTIDISMPGSTTETIAVQHFGTLRYPAQAVGTSRGPVPRVPVAGGGPFPFVVFSHGRFHEDPYIGHNHEQASYLIEHLASWGFVVASVNLDVVGQYGQPAAIKQRGEIVLATIAAFQQLDPALYDIDFEHIGLVGHSRGGEGCLAAWKNNTAGYPIAAIATIALTNFQEQFLEGVPYLGLLGSKDGDVSNGWPIHVYDQAAPAPKLFEYIEGANHFWFTDSIHFSGEGQALITREQHHDVARTYITAFLLSTLHDAPLPLQTLCRRAVARAGHRADHDPPAVRDAGPAADQPLSRRPSPTRPSTAWAAPRSARRWSRRPKSRSTTAPRPSSTARTAAGSPTTPRPACRRAPRPSTSRSCPAASTPPATRTSRSTRCSAGTRRSTPPTRARTCTSCSWTARARARRSR